MSFELIANLTKSGVSRGFLWPTTRKTHRQKEMELKTKKATPITDLMAYHLSQLCDEMGAGRPLESGLAGSVERALQDTEKLNSLERHSNPGTLARIANKTTESLASGAASRLSVEYTAAWEGVVDSLLADFGFVWDGSDEGTTCDYVALIRHMGSHLCLCSSWIFQRDALPDASCSSGVCGRI